MTVRLALDSSLRVPSCAVSTPEGIFPSTGTDDPVGGFARIINECLRMAGIQVSEIDEIVSGVGPGSYMGVRTALTTANVLGFALCKDVRGVLSVDSLVANAPEGRNTVAVPAGRGRWFVAKYDRQASEYRRRFGPCLVDSAPIEAWRADPPGVADTGSAVLDATGVLTVAEDHRYLLTPQGSLLRPFMSTTPEG